jgi:predicted small lipoprotein YifL
MRIKSLLTFSTLVVLAGCSLGPKAPESNPETTSEAPNQEATMPQNGTDQVMPPVEETMPPVEETMPESSTGDETANEEATGTVEVQVVPNPEY